MSTRDGQIDRVAEVIRSLEANESVVTCGNVRCGAPAQYEIGFGELGKPSKAIIYLCEACWHRWMDDLGLNIEIIDQAKLGT